MKNFVVKDTNAQQRLDVFVAQNMPELTRAAVKKLLEQRKVWVNGKDEKAGYKVRPRDTVTVDHQLVKSQSMPILKLPVLYQDNDCLVINKPVGILTHSKGAFNPEPTVATWLAERLKKPTTPQNAHLQEPSLQNREGIVHRLDRVTSGVMICAKNPAALSWLQKQFSTRKVKKTYVAIVHGAMEPPEAIIDMPIERNPKKPQTFRAGVAGRPARTIYKVIKNNGQYSLLELQPQTGRTHQLRVHLKQIGHPIVGDTIYGGQPAKRVFCMLGRWT